MQEPARFILMYLVLPLWVAAGFTDWACHRATRIERTSGLKENLLHWVMFGEMGVGIVAVALFEIDAAVLLLVLVLFGVHELTVYWDLHYSTPRRYVGPFEQMVHSVMEILPLLSLALLAAMAWPQAQALVGTGDARCRLVTALEGRAVAAVLPGRGLHGVPAAQRAAPAAGNLDVRAGAPRGLRPFRPRIPASPAPR